MVIQFRYVALLQLCGIQCLVTQDPSIIKVQSMQNLVCYRSISGKTCLRLVETLGLPVTMTGNFCSIFNDVTGKISHDRSKFGNHQAVCPVV